MLSARMAQQLAHGAASFTIPVSNAKRSQRDVTHAVRASSAVATCDANDEVDEDDVFFDALSGEKDRGGPRPPPTIPRDFGGGDVSLVVLREPRVPALLWVICTRVAPALSVGAACASESAAAAETAL